MIVEMIVETNGAYRFRLTITIFQILKCEARGI